MSLDEIIKDSIFLKSLVLASGFTAFGFATYSIGYGVYKFGSYIKNKVSDYLDRMFEID